MPLHKPEIMYIPAVHAELIERALFPHKNRAFYITYISNKDNNNTQTRYCN
jgi:hypothetical protein